MDVDLTPARPEDEPVLARLFQLYCYDFSEILGFDVGDDGLFDTHHPERYWSAPRYHPFFVRASGSLAGFLIVDTQSRLTGEPLWDMNQFFVLRWHRGAGVGARAATAAFDAFPGRWEVREAPKNTAAQAFWRKVIGRYTGGSYTEVVGDDDRFRGVMQRFVSGGRV